jgi:hypothetical protein
MSVMPVPKMATSGSVMRRGSPGHTGRDGLGRGPRRRIAAARTAAPHRVPATMTTMWRAPARRNDAARRHRSRAPRPRGGARRPWRARRRARTATAPWAGASSSGPTRAKTTTAASTESGSRPASSLVAPQRGQGGSVVVGNDEQRGPAVADRGRPSRRQPGWLLRSTVAPGSTSAPGGSGSRDRGWWTTPRRGRRCPRPSDRPRWWKSIPARAYSPAWLPTPTPRMKRPPERFWRDVACLATPPGGAAEAGVCNSPASAPGRRRRDGQRGEAFVDGVGPVQMVHGP